MASSSTERRRGGWRWHLSYWLGRLYRHVRLLLLPPNRPPELAEDCCSDSAYDDDDSLTFIVDPNGAPPRRTTIGYDVLCPRNTHINARASLSIDAGVRVRPPPGYYVRLNSRSSLSSRGVHCSPDIIDPDDPRGVRCLLTNATDDRVDIRAGERMAQLTLERDNTDVRILFRKSNRPLAANSSSKRCPFGSTGK